MCCAINFTKSTFTDFFNTNIKILFINFILNYIYIKYVYNLYIKKKKKKEKKRKINIETFNK